MTNLKMAKPLWAKRLKTSEKIIVLPPIVLPLILLAGLLFTEAELTYSFPSIVKTGASSLFFKKRSNQPMICRYTSSLCSRMA